MAWDTTLRPFARGIVTASAFNAKVLEALRYLKGEQSGQTSIVLDAPVEVPNLTVTGGGSYFHTGLTATGTGTASVTLDRAGWWAVKCFGYSAGTSASFGTVCTYSVYRLTGGTPPATATAFGAQQKTAHYWAGAGNKGLTSGRAIGRYNCLASGETVGASGPSTVRVYAYYLGPYTGSLPIDTSALATVVAHWRGRPNELGETTITDLVGSYDITTTDPITAAFTGYSWADLYYFPIDQPGTTAVANDFKTWLFGGAHWLLMWARVRAESAPNNVTVPIDVATTPGAASLYSLTITDGVDVTLVYEKTGGATQTATWAGAIAADGLHLIGIQVTPGSGADADVSLFVDGALVTTVTQAKPETTHGADDVNLLWHAGGAGYHGVVDCVIGTGTLTEAQCLTEYERGTA